MIRVLDASMALAWLFKRVDPAEAVLADKALEELSTVKATVPSIWYAEVANAVLRGERQGVVQATQTAFFISDLSQAEIETDEQSPRTRQASVLDLARTHGLTAYDATYLELAMRRAAVLATFDRKLAGAARAAGVRVFGDPA
ncbi:MAG: type II toxin-antitoxin system VapC family toxin [Terracidiphilus sp.]